MRNLYKVFFVNDSYKRPSVFFLVAEQFCKLGKKIEEIERKYPELDGVDKIEAVGCDLHKTSPELQIWVAK